MEYTQIELSTYPRKSHFEYFNNMHYPYVGTTVNVDITAIYKVIKENKLPFFLTILYAAVNAANQTDEFRRRIVLDRIIEYKTCYSSHTVALEDETYCYCQLNCNQTFDEFINYAKNEQENAKGKKNTEDGENVNSLIFVSSSPWLSFTSLIQPTPSPADSNPRITFGKYFFQGDKAMLPVAVLVNHALVDGIHIAKFYEKFQENCLDICSITVKEDETK